MAGRPKADWRMIDTVPVDGWLVFGQLTDWPSLD